MGILDKKKKTVKTPSNSSTSKNVQKNGSRKASYSLSYQNETQVIYIKNKFSIFNWYF